MLTRLQRETLIVLYAILGLGCLLVLLGAPDELIGIFAMPGLANTAITLYKVCDEWMKYFGALV